MPTVKGTFDTSRTDAARSRRFTPPQTDATPVESFARSPVADAGLMRRPAPQPAPSSSASATGANPVVGSAQPAPTLLADASTSRPSPKDLPTEADFFTETLSMIQNAKPGDIIGVQMYEFQNALTNGTADAASGVAGYTQQQALLPALAQAAQRGVNVNVILDASSNPKTRQYKNQPIADYLKQQAGSTGNMHVDFYPPQEVNIDHAKEAFHLTPSGTPGTYNVVEAIGGGSNYGNHTAANNDGGMAFYGIDGVGAVQIFYEDQAHCRGQQITVNAPPIPDTAVHWYANTPSNPGAQPNAILNASLNLLSQGNEAYDQEYVITQPQVMAALEKLGSNAHLLTDSSESTLDANQVSQLQQAGVQQKWAVVPDGGIMHRKDLEVLNNGQIVGLRIGSANTTDAGMIDSTPAHKTNHEIVAVVMNYTSPDGQYSTLPALQSVLNTAETNMANGQDTPQKGTASGAF